MRQLFLVFLTVFNLFAFRSSGSARALASFGSGITTCQGLAPVTLNNPRVVSGGQCTRAGIQAALDQGGQILLSCGSTPIPIDQTLTLNPTVDTVLDGNGSVTLDGQLQTRILFKGWHNAQQHPSVTVTLQNIRLIRGKAPAGEDGSGGALMAGYPGTRVHIINATFEDNTTTDQVTPDNQGGAIFVHNSYEVILSGSLFKNNSAGNGGALGEIAAGVVVYNSQFTNNRASDASDGDVVRGYGGALALDGVWNDYNPTTNNTFQVCGSLFDGNTAVRGGGAIDAVLSDASGTKITLDRSTFTNNNVTGYMKDGSYKFGQGGAFYYVEDDRAGGSGEDNLEIRASTFSGNQARMQGGAVWVSMLGQGRIVNSTFSANTTTAPLNTVGQGGAVIIGSGTLDVTNNLFANNHAAYQGGALFAGSEPGAVVTLANTIFYNNTLNVQTSPSETKWQGYHTNRTLADGGNNIQYPRYKPDFPGNEVNNQITAAPIYLDPLISTLAGNGGPTQTMALQSGSPAINAAGAAKCPAFDQRGYVRQGACDIGPFEYGGLPFVATEWLYLPSVRK